MEWQGGAGFATRPGRGLELGFLGAVWVAAAALLGHGVSLDLWRDGTIGPGAYPVFALAGLLAITTALIGKALTARELRLYSPFAAGLQDDGRLRQLASAMSKRAGIRIRVVTKDGEGRFSALWTGLRAGRAGDVLAVVASDLTSVPNFHAAALCHGQLEPVGGLFFDPDLLVVAPESPWRSPAELRSGDPLRLGFANHGDIDHAVDRWLAAGQGLVFEPTYSDDGAALLDALRAGRLDAAVLRASQARPALAVGNVRCIAIFSEPHLHAGVAGVTRFTQDGPPVVSGHWAALMVPAGMASQKKVALEEAFAGAMADPPSHYGTAGPDRGWSFLSAADMRDLIDIQRRCLEQFQAVPAAAGPPRGKLVGLIAAIAGLALFPFVMTELGYVITAFGYVGGLMLLLWPRVTPARAAVSAAAAAALSVGTWLLFTRVFEILLPAPAFLEGMLP